jgi:hypothetical protein
MRKRRTPRRGAIWSLQSLQAAMRGLYANGKRSQQTRQADGRCPRGSYTADPCTDQRANRRLPGCARVREQHQKRHLIAEGRECAEIVLRNDVRRHAYPQR